LCEKREMSTAVSSDPHGANGGAVVAAAPSQATGTTSTPPGDSNAAASFTTQAQVTTAPVILTDAAVLEYLKRKGLGTAALELSKMIKGDTEAEDARGQISSNKSKGDRERLEEEDAIFRNQRTLLAKVTSEQKGLGACRFEQWTF
jgi:hypothetical protein